MFTPHAPLSFLCSCADQMSDTLMGPGCWVMGRDWSLTHWPRPSALLATGTSPSSPQDALWKMSPLLIGISLTRVLCYGRGNTIQAWQPVPAPSCRCGCFFFNSFFSHHGNNFLIIFFYAFCRHPPWGGWLWHWRELSDLAAFFFWRTRLQQENVKRCNGFQRWPSLAVFTVASPVWLHYPPSPDPASRAHKSQLTDRSDAALVDQLTGFNSSEKKQKKLQTLLDVQQQQTLMNTLWGEKRGQEAPVSQMSDESQADSLVFLVSGCHAALFFHPPGILFYFEQIFSKLEKEKQSCCGNKKMFAKCKNMEGMVNFFLLFVSFIFSPCWTEKKKAAGDVLDSQMFWQLCGALDY